MRGAPGQCHHLAKVHRTVAPARLSDPTGIRHSRHPCSRSLGGNQLCGLFPYNGIVSRMPVCDYDGTYTTEGITKLCEGLRGSAVTSIKCAAAP